MDANFHIIKNFPDGYPWYKKVYAHMMFLLGSSTIHRRSNFLNYADFKKSLDILLPGDVLLTGGLRRLSKIFIGNIVTHSLVYCGNHKVIHSNADGVKIDSVYEILREYDTLVILRHKYAPVSQVQKFLMCLSVNIGKPYDFEFKEGADKLYCAELIKVSAIQADLEILPKTKISNSIVYPIELMNGYFNVKFLSHNLEIKDGCLYLLDPQGNVIDKQLCRIHN